ncbi:hypothetical protein NE237_016818 [Protea cynaroides]|uniref:Uncharacterized protein n=1 Tax=Protea cynaroides TaxID=273540 RepID=A0A9Q0K5V0_9MAGN|nr:hypothetical protein NE237_016818 [Protea cynaroides]
MDPSFEPPNKAPPTLLNAFTWGLHMGLSSNFRFQTLNGDEDLHGTESTCEQFSWLIVLLLQFKLPPFFSSSFPLPLPYRRPISVVAHPPPPLLLISDSIAVAEFFYSSTEYSTN